MESMNGEYEWNGLERALEAGFWCVDLLVDLVQVVERNGLQSRFEFSRVLPEESNGRAMRNTTRPTVETRLHQLDETLRIRVAGIPALI